jgi:hypothetical protein
MTYTNLQGSSNLSTPTTSQPVDASTQTAGQALFLQASQNHEPDVLVRNLYSRQQNQSQKNRLSNDFVNAAGRNGLNKLAQTPSGQHALAVVYDNSSGEHREFMENVHKEQGNTAVDYTNSDSRVMDRLLSGTGSLQDVEPNGFIPSKSINVIDDNRKPNKPLDINVQSGKTISNDGIQTEIGESTRVEDTFPMTSGNRVTHLSA